MREFSEDFFKEEIREGFVVSEMMKRCWAAQLTIYDQLKEIFDKNNLTYYAEVGTLLGTVRHKGYIPWDDDIDLAMPREDYMKFLAMEKELPEGLYIRSFYNTETFSSYHAVVANGQGKLTWDDERTKKYCGCPFICFIDIFPLDYSPKDPEKFRIRKQLYYYSYKMAYDCMMMEEALFSGRLVTLGELEKKAKEEGEDCHEMIRTFLSEFDQLVKFQAAVLGKRDMIDPEKSLRNQLYLAADHVARICPKEEAGGIDYSVNLALFAPPNIDKPRHLEWYKETTELPYEDITIPVPIGYMEELKNQYGPGFMTPLRFASGHGYPFFRAEVSVFMNGDTGDNYVTRAAESSFAEMFGTIYEAHWLICQRTGAAYRLNYPQDYPENNKGVSGEELIDRESALDLLGQLQEGVTALGTALEQTFGEGVASVGHLEKACEHIFETYKLVEADASRHDIYKSLADVSVAINCAQRETYKDFHKAALDDTFDEWQKVLRPEGKEHRVVILYAITATDLVNAGHAGITRMREFFSFVDGDKENVAVILFAPKGARDFMAMCKLDMLDDYASFMEDISRAGNVILVEDPATSDIERGAILCDEYYGDLCGVNDACANAGKPVTLRNAQLLKY